MRRWRIRALFMVERASNEDMTMNRRPRALAIRATILRYLQKYSAHVESVEQIGQPKHRDGVGMIQSAATDDVFHALSNPTRRKVLERLSAGPATVSELAAPFDMQLPSFVQHLSVLEQSRLVKSKKRGRVRTYEIAPERFKVAEDWLAARRQMWEARLNRFDQYVKQLKEKESAS
jgi:DNA-binding transcriptional ArsR family regulator